MWTWRSKCLKEKISEFEDKTDVTSNHAELKNDALKQLEKENHELLELVKDEEKE